MKPWSLDLLAIALSERVARLRAPHIAVRLIEPLLARPTYTLSQIWHPRSDGDAAHRWLRKRFVLAARKAAPDRLRKKPKS